VRDEPDLQGDERDHHRAPRDHFAPRSHATTMSLPRAARLRGASP
jgi:hypothetical protein